MARKKVSRSLPDLRGHKRLKKGDNITQSLLYAVRRIAIAAQEESPRAFYAIRDVAKRFSVPLTTVSRVYRTLEQEGLLQSVRGSRTVLSGRTYDRRLSVRAFVGLPASLSHFVTMQDYRMFFIRIRRELRLRRFATSTLFLERTTPADLHTRLGRYEIDTVIWLSPNRLARDAAPVLRDNGIRMIAVSDGGLPTVPCRYQVHRDQAVREILRSWKIDRRIKQVSVVCGTSRRSAAEEERLHEILENERMRHEFVSVRSNALSSFLENLRDHNALLFAASAATFSAFRAPDSLTELIRERPVAFVHGPVNMPFANVPDTAVDLVHVDWQLVAERIVSDLINQTAFDVRETVTFEAQAKLRVPLSEYAQSI